MKTELGSLKTVFAPAKPEKEATPLSPAPVDEVHPALRSKDRNPRLSANWLPYFFREKLVYCDSNYRVHVKTKISESDVAAAGRFSDGMARILLKSKDKIQGNEYIDESGKIVIAPDANREYAGPFSEGLACILDAHSHKVGFIDKKGKQAIPFLFYVTETASGVGVQKPQQLENCIFAEGLAPVYNGKANAADLTPCCGFIDHRGKFVIPPNFIEAFPFVEKRAQVCVRDNSQRRRRWGFIDSKGKMQVKATYMEVQSYSQGLAAVLDYLGKWGYIDLNGNYVIPAKFYDALPFSEGFAAVAITKDDKPQWGYIRKNGEWLADAQFERAESFFNGEARASNGYDEKSKKSKVEFRITKRGKIEKYADGLLPFDVSNLQILDDDNLEPSSAN
ncbi:MAG: WG repeat-containing protein [Candidatus Obscuribacterales bacterium]|nr:WG repeat-containing protein [Candidatus Obscuribacterales bacterium]